ncbi:hypothetical protein KAU11_10815, partial [Candidatus Babeliales bacterium]|nr:hypothetical protein [Candidatus Babeliales bacterium]
IIKKGIVPNCVRKDDYKWELVTPKREFEVGEKVRLKKYDAMHEGNKGIGIIIPDNIPTTLGTYTVKFDGYTNTYQVKYLELVDKKQTNEVKDKMEDRVDKMEDRMDEMKYRANVMKIEDIKKANIKEARKQWVEEARNAEITEAKAQYNMAVDERDRLDRKITQLEGQKAQQQEILDRFKD